MVSFRRLLGLGVLLCAVAMINFFQNSSQGQQATGGGKGAAGGFQGGVSTPKFLTTVADERDADKIQRESPFSKGGVFTYRPSKTEQLFALALKPTLPPTSVAGRDYLIMISLSATQAGDGWLAAGRIAETLAEQAGENDRICLWTIGTPAVTRNLTKEFLSPKNPDHQAKIKAAMVRVRSQFPAGDTDLIGGITQAMETFDGAPTRQRLLVFLGDGQSTHNPMSADERSALAQEMVARKIGFFPVPLGLHLHAENLHGLANATGGAVLRTRVNEELLSDCMKRYFAAFHVPVLYDVEIALPDLVKDVYPTKMPPMRGDASVLVAGKMQIADQGNFPITVKGTPLGSRTPISVSVSEKIIEPRQSNFFLVTLIDQWKNAKDRPALLQGDRALALSSQQIKLNRDEWMATAEMAMKELKLDDAVRAFEQVKVMAPLDPEPDAGLRVIAKIRAGKLPPDAMMDAFKNRPGLALQQDGKWKVEGVQGKFVDNRLIARLQDDKDVAPNPPVKVNVPQPGGQERNDLLENHRDLRVIQEQKWTEIVENALRVGRRELQMDPDGTLDSLRNILSRVQEQPDLSDRLRTGLASRLTTALREAKAQATLLKARRDEVHMNVATVKAILEREQQVKTLEQRQSEQLANFRSQIEIAYFDEKTKVDVLQNLLSLQTENRLRGQNWPVAAQASYEMVLAGYNLEKSNQLRRQREDRYLATMLALEKSFIPFPDEPGIEFPKISTWRQLTQQRKEKYEVSNLPDDVAGRKAANSLLRLLDEEIEIPEEFKQPVPLTLVFKFLRDKLSARGKALPIWIDQNAFKEENPEAPSLLETTVTYPEFLQKMPIAVALRVALSQFPTNNATYLIRRDYIEVTTNERAIIEKVIRVHPVADLTIPISQTGGVQQFGQSGQSNFGGGNFGGGNFGGGNFGGGNFGGGNFGGGNFGGGNFGGGNFGGGGFGGFQQGNSLGGTTGSFNGGSFSGGFNGSLGALGGTQGMQDLIQLITIVVDPGHWYYVQQQATFQQGINNAFNNQALGNLGGGLGGGGALGALGGALGGMGGGAPFAGGPGTPAGQGGPADLLDPHTNTIYPYMPTLALIVRAQARTHTSLTGGIIGGKKAAGAMIMGQNGVVPIDDLLNGKGKIGVANAGKNKGPQDPKNPVTLLTKKDPLNDPAKPGKAMPLQIDPKIWDAVLADGNIPANMIIATAEALFDQPDKKHVAEFLKANLRRGIVVQPWVFECLATALEMTGGDPEEIRRARLSAIALDPKDAGGFLEAARTMADNGQHDRALAFCRQAAFLEPNMAQTYENALAYAHQSSDAKAMQWAAAKLVSQDWPVENQILHLKAQTRVETLAQSLEKNANKSDADKLRAALTSLKQRDLVVNLTWETSQEAADLELFVKEPTGTTCSFDQKQTSGGGTLLVNDFKVPNKVTYVAAQAFPGAYEISIRKLWGRPLFGQARLEIIQNLGTPNERRQLEIIKLDQLRNVTVQLAEGNRSALAIVSPSNLKKRESQSGGARVNGYEQLRRLAYPEYVSGGTSSGASSPGKTLSESIPNGRTAMRSAVGASMNVETRVNASGAVSLVMQPVYQTLKAGQPGGNLAGIPGSK